MVEMNNDQVSHEEGSIALQRVRWIADFFAIYSRVPYYNEIPENLREDEVKGCYPLKQDEEY